MLLPYENMDMDINSPMEVAAITKFKYFVIFTDDGFDPTEVFPLVNRVAAVKIYKICVARCLEPLQPKSTLSQT